MSFSAKFGSLITAMITPFEEDGSLDTAAVGSLIEHLVQTCTSALLVTGTTGENPTLTYAEEWELLKLVKERSQSKVPLIFNAGSNCTRTAIEVAKEAEMHKVDALMLVSPYYNKPNQEGIYAHFSAVAEKTSLPIMLYNNPGRTASLIEPETVLRLVRAYPGRFQAIKESSGQMDLITRLRIEVPEIEIYSGDDNLTLPILALGGVGSVSVASHLIGREVQELTRLFLSGDHLEAAKIHYRIFPLVKALFASPSPGPVKYLLSVEGICKPYLRLPLTSPAPDVRKALETAYRGLVKLSAFRFSH
ncbi:MAG: 4-hydroxy-tetrahydrodipicolinate synthase [Candidatus Caenarcaniphilales bacterium]|nr:4-hydroxy-tetrahydrodipicolinate synthase [Candidatus Caenarcaniphilales bacterium]